MCVCIKNFFNKKTIRVMFLPLYFFCNSCENSDDNDDDNNNCSQMEVVFRADDSNKKENSIFLQNTNESTTQTNK